jgi:hypothetical protein
MKLLGKILFAAVVYVCGVVMTGMITTALRVPPIELPFGMSPEKAFFALAMASPLLTAAVLPVALGLRSGWGKRWLVIASLMFISIGVNTALEGSIFSTIMSGRGAYIALLALLPCLFAAAVLTWGKCNTATEISRPALIATEWAWRLLAAWLAFPVIYWCFGSLIAPVVMDYYRAGVGGLRIPPTETILGMQLLRGVLFLVATIPIVLLWRKSRRAFIVSVGLAYAVAVGAFQLVQGTFLPVFLRVIHTVEIAADSFAYAAVFGLLFLRGEAAKKSLAKTAGTEREDSPVRS